MLSLLKLLIILPFYGFVLIIALLRGLFHFILVSSVPAENVYREDMRHRPIQYKRSEDDEILTVMELKHPESMFSTGPYANSIKTNGMTLRPRKYEESSQPTMVRLPDKALWIQQTLSVKNSKMMYRQSAKEPEVSSSKDTLENCDQNSVGESINASSGFTGISSTTASHCFAASAVDVEDHFDQTNEEIGEELHESDDVSRKAPCANGLSTKNDLSNINLSDEWSNVTLKSALDDNQLLRESKTALSANGLSSVKELDVLQETDDLNENSVLLDLNDSQSDEQQALQRRLCCIFDEVLVVDNVLAARKVVHLLTHEHRHRVHACDTEVSTIDVKLETPVDHGQIICFSIYSGKDVDYGNGKNCIWVDVLDGGGKDILAEFAPFFEDSSIKKVWHNYSFDCHVIENYGIKLSGFHADTMHMARLWDSSRRTDGGYSLEALTSNPNVMSENKVSLNEDLMGKVSMKTIFGKRKIKKDGSLGKTITLPSVEELQREERQPWICYSSLDSISTLKLYESLKSKLSKMLWIMDGKCMGNMLGFYENYWKPFGELLVQMETEGMLVDRAYLSEVEKVAIVQQEVAADRFRNWASKYCSDAMYMNVGSDTQLRTLLFGGICNRKNHNECLPTERKFKIPNIDNVIEEGKKTAKKFRDITLHKIGDSIQTDFFAPSGWPSVSGDALKAIAGKVSAEYDFAGDAFEDPLVDESHNPGKKDVDLSAYGTAYDAFGRGKEGMEACHAIAALIEICSIDSLISNFILPLQGSHVSGRNKRIHCSLNINTETGRLSARRPNLQNQPALEKDRYKIRQAFVAAPGNSLIVADYGQLELRILAHLADCKSMKEAFEAGGDFHSRTAMNMYPYIREAVQREEVFLEWHPQPGQEKPPVPLLKDAFGSERRKAKMLNFSIAYGKTPIGLAKDWKVSVAEAKETVDLWYKERQEVLRWQEARKKEAAKHGCVHTLLGRARRFPSMAEASKPQKSHIERAAINTPVQGSAADVAMCAMLELDRNNQLKELGWKLLLQVHDEVILEGPSESAETAKAIVVECMSKPFNGKNILTVELSVDAKCAQNWYAAK
ncbi:DNA polymerase I B, chloroplastic/mitochondrial-like isoform X2 [Amaranthus tricolor]|uniref:DNA polymerase I B, chloroplastic/mitochondrial-like isoform X2 n=1 Tax=Amaranthus tricolor TaxID=29722 RepID=UPI00258CB0AE|nr:DNA polymerase I B, chloroplastic/mitochondrial-like isoform X2 [Amaranthus tricolor]